MFSLSLADIVLSLISHDFKLESTPMTSAPANPYEELEISFPATGSMDLMAAVSGAITLVAQLIDVTSKVIIDVTNAPKDLGKLMREATGLLVLLTDLRYWVEETTSTDPWFSGLRSLEEPLMEFKITMEDIADKLTPAIGLKKVLRWTLDKKQVDAALSKIERLKTIVVFALTKDHL